MKPFTDFEKHILSQPVPSLALPALIDPSEIDLVERAARINYADEEFCKRGEGNLVALAKIVGILPSSRAERRQCIGDHND